MTWINKHLEKIALTAVILAALWVIFGPLLLTQTYFTITDFAGGENNTGLIGDTIGGITAPVVGLISVILLYLALIKQIESNKASVAEANFRIIYEELAQLRNSAERYTYENETGIEAIGKFAADIGVKDNLGQLTQGHYEVLDKFDLLLNKFHKIFYLLDNLKTSEEYKDILAKDLQHIFSIYFNNSYNLMQGQWAVSEEDLGDLIKGKMHMVKDHLRLILADVLKRNPKK